MTFWKCWRQCQPSDEASDLPASHHRKEDLVDILVNLETLQSHLILNIIWGFGFPLWYNILWIRLLRRLFLGYLFIKTGFLLVLGLGWIVEFDMCGCWPTSAAGVCPCIPSNMCIGSFWVYLRVIISILVPKSFVYVKTHFIATKYSIWPWDHVFFFSEIDGDGFALFSLTKNVNVLSVLVEEWKWASGK